MTRPVNPPDLLRIPQAFLSDREAVAFFDQLRTVLSQMYDRTGGTTDLIGNLDIGTPNFFDVYAQQNSRAIAGLPEFTMDTTGFTMDTTTMFTMDKVTA